MVGVTPRRLRCGDCCHRLTLFRLAGSSIRAANPSPPSDGESGVGGGRPASSDLGEIRSDPIRRRFIGTLTARVQVCQRSAPPNGSRALPAPRWQADPRSPQIATQCRICTCASPSTNPISRRTPERFCACAPASASRRISSSRLAFRPPIAPSAAPAWTISTPSTIVRHRSWPEFEAWRRGERHRLVLFTTAASLSYLDYRYSADDVLLFGRESAGVPEEVHAGGRRAPRDSHAARPALAQCRDRRRHGRRRGAAADRRDADALQHGEIANYVYYVNIHLCSI